MESCELCGRPLDRVMGVVKDGTVYEAFRCGSGHHHVVDTRCDHLPVQCVTIEGVPVARVDCGENCYIFDRRIIRSTLRAVLEFARKSAANLVLDISKVSFVGEPHLNALRHLDDDLAGRGLSLAVVTGSAVVAREVCGAVPRLTGQVFAKEADALARARGGPTVAEAAG